MFGDKTIFCFILFSVINFSGVNSGGDGSSRQVTIQPSGPCDEIDFTKYEIWLLIIEQYSATIVQLAKSILDELREVPVAILDEGAIFRLVRLTEMVRQLLDAVRKFNVSQSELIDDLESLVPCDEEKRNALLDAAKSFNPTEEVLLAIQTMNNYLTGGETSPETPSAAPLMGALDIKKPFWNKQNVIEDELERIITQIDQMEETLTA
ncbi:CLUMA_CG010517, isoform A [Clunio marinus]|uniref:CLUMA_CG010517, isoform A n=1 Tax=Clunio marinus TaxID=568069 RepID=A0A1J1IA37_9DIPT|nr:CLUMA_CG010517, isoform A [Clunio marinus]